MSRASWIGLFLLISTWAQAAQKAPEVFVVRILGGKEAPMVAETPMDAALVGQLDREGRVVPIAWTNGDQLFRELVGDRVSQSQIDNPTLSHVLRTAQSLRIEYVITVGFTIKDGEDPRPLCQLYRSSSDRPIWQYGGEKGQELMLTAVRTAQGIDWANTVDSWARTWTAQLGAGPFKNFTPRGRSITVDLEPGMAFGPSNPIPPAVIDPKIRERADKLMAEGFPAEAITMLRDAIDVNPLDVETRIALVKALTTQDQMDAAASEALLAAQLMPEQTKLRQLAAQALIRVGRFADARAQLNEALARAADDAETDRLLGDLALLSGDRIKAIESYERSVKRSPSFGADFGLLLCQALEGNSQEVDRLAATLAKPTQTELNEVYRMVVQLSWDSAQKVANDLKEALAKGRMKERDPEAIGLATRALGISQSLTKVLETLKAPARFAKSHERRVLAHSLLQQSAAEALDFIRSGNKDTGDEATLSLGEALKQFPAVRAEFESELSQP